MGKIVTVELTVGATVQFSHLLSGLLRSGWTFPQPPPQFFREVFDPASNEERNFEQVQSNTQTLSDFLDELDSLYQSGNNLVVNLEHREVFAFVSWKQGHICEFSLVGTSIRLPDDEGNQTRWTDWNRVINLIGPPANKHGIYIEAMELYEDF